MFIIHAASLALTGALIALAWIDLRTFRLPDSITLPLTATGLAMNVLVLHTPWVSLIGALAGYLAFIAIEIGYRHLRGRNGLGRGDAKLLAAGGAWCGAWLLPGMVMVATLSALIHVGTTALIRRRMPDAGRALAFGPWLALGILAGWMYRIYGPGLYPVL